MAIADAPAAADPAPSAKEPREKDSSSSCDETSVEQEVVESSSGAIRSLSGTGRPVGGPRGPFPRRRQSCRKPRGRGPSSACTLLFGCAVALAPQDFRGAKKGGGQREG